MLILKFFSSPSPLLLSRVHPCSNLRSSNSRNHQLRSGRVSTAPMDKVRDFLIPSYMLDPEEEPVENPPPPRPSCPVIVFVNTRSGGQLGSHLLATYRSLLNEAQVFDLGVKAPERVLQEMFGNMERLKQGGDALAAHVLKTLRLIVAGGDGTAGWLLGVVCDLKLNRSPPIATAPLGTGNNLPYSFGWGKKNPGTDSSSVISFLNEVKVAEEMNIDNWHITMKMRAPKQGSFDPIPPPDLPHSLHKFRRQSSIELRKPEEFLTYRGGFWNYFSMGMDAQVSYAFHSARKVNPEKFKNQLANQRMYAKLGLKQGWFFPGGAEDHSCSNLSKLAKVKVKRKVKDTITDWEDLEIPKSMRSIVCLNLPSFSGGLNPWGTPDPKKPKYKDFSRPYVDDGRIEVVGFKDAWHGLLLFAPKGHGTRLAQVHRIKFEFHKGAAKETYMRLDGEPWKQPLPEDDDTVVVDISHHGQVTMLATRKCTSRSCAGSSVEQSMHDVYDNSEVKRKFGASDTFIIPDHSSTSHLN